MHSVVDERSTKEQANWSMFEQSANYRSNDDFFWRIHKQKTFFSEIRKLKRSSLTFSKRVLSVIRKNHTLFSLKIH